MKDKYHRFLLWHFITVLFLIFPVFIPGVAKAATPATGTVNVLVLMADFPDKPGQVQRTYFEDLMFGNKPSIAPLGSFADYYSEVSYNQLSITGRVNDGMTNWYRMLQTYSYYTGPGNCNGGCPGTYPNNVQKLVEDAVILADATTSIDFGQFDTDNDGFVDALFIVHAGYRWQLRMQDFVA